MLITTRSPGQGENADAGITGRRLPLLPAYRVMHQADADGVFRHY